MMESTSPATTVSSPPEEGEESTRARHLTPYVRLVKEAIQHTNSRPDLLRLFEAEELEPVPRFLNDLSERAQCLLVRLILRKGPWFRIDSMLNYREVHGDAQPAHPDEQQQHRSESQEQTRKALNLAELVAELQQQRLLIEVSLEDPLEALQAVQQVLSGPELRTLVDKLGLKVKSAAKLTTKQAAVQVLQDRLQKQASMFATKLPVGREASRLLRSQPQASSFPADLPVIVRVDPNFVTAIRRIIRVTQLTCWNSAATSGRTAISVNEPQTWNTSLLVILGKIRFPKYSCQISSPPFANQQQFRRWEIANELRWWMEKCMLLPETMGHPFSYSSHMFATHLTRCGLEVAAKPIEADADRKPVLDAFPDMLAAAEDLCVSFLAAFPCDQKQQQEGSFVLEVCTTYARNEVDVFVFWGMLATLLLQLHHASDDGASPSSLPEYLKHLDAGSVLCTIVWDTISAFEQTRDYIAAILLLRTLLGTPYMSHRRGRWYQRLAIDLEHLGFYAAALDAAQAAVLDPSVKGGDRLTMQKKLAKLKKKIVVDGNASRAAERLALTVFGHILGGRVCTCAQQQPVCITTVNQLLQFVLSDDAHLSTFQDQRASSVTTAVRVHTMTTREFREEVVMVLAGDDGDDNDDDDEVKDDAEDLLFVAQKPVRAHTVSVVRSSKICKAEMKSQGMRRLNSLDSFFTKTEVSEVAISSTTTAAASSSSTSSKRKSEGSSNDDLGPADSELSMEDVQMLGLIEPPWKWRGLQVRSITGRRLNNVTGFKSRFVGYNDGDVCDVENLVLQDLFETGGWFGWHCEGGPVRTIFSLLMWDILFAPYPDVFQTPFQDAPLDLDYPPLFYTQRIHFIEERLQEIAAADHGTLCKWLSESYRSHYREMCRGVSWRYELRALQLAAVCVGGLGLSAICRALSVNYKQLASGQPDLMMVRARPAVRSHPACTNSSLTMLETPQGMVLDLGAWLGDALFDKTETDKLLPADADLTSLASAAAPAVKASSTTPRSATLFTYEGDDLQLSALGDGWVFECMFVEVKGPSDALADKQRLWLQILSSCGLTAYVCKVREGLENQPKGSHADHASNKKRRLSRQMSK